jgi:hypothetical protein
MRGERRRRKASYPQPLPEGRGAGDGHGGKGRERRRDGAGRSPRPTEEGGGLVWEEAVFAQVYFARGMGGYVGVYYVFGWTLCLYQALLDPDHAVA